MKICLKKKSRTKVMGKDIGTNTDPMDVEIYIENGLIKGRIIMSNNDQFKITSTESHTIDEEVQHILNSCCDQIFIINPKRDYSFIYVAEMLSMVEGIATKNINYNNFDYRLYGQITGINNTREQLWSMYLNDDTNVHEQISLINSIELSYINAMINIIQNAKNYQYPEIIILINDKQVSASNINKFIDEKNDIELSLSSFIITSYNLNNFDLIIDISSFIIKEKMYDILLTKLLKYNSSMFMCLIELIDENYFDVHKLNNQLFT
jgi:hypothetical protein